MATPRDYPLHQETFDNTFLESIEDGPVPSNLEVLAADALQWTSASGAAIVLEEDGAFICKASVGPSVPPYGTVLDPNNGFSGMCLRTGSVLTCTDTGSDTRVNQEACRILGIRSIVTVPVISDGKVAGLIEVVSPDAEAFDDPSVDFLRELAAELASSMQKDGASLTEGVVALPDQRETPQAEHEDEQPPQDPSPQLMESPPTNVEPPTLLVPEDSHITRNVLLMAAALAALIAIPVGIRFSHHVPVPLRSEAAQAHSQSPGTPPAGIAESVSDRGAAQLDKRSAYEYASTLAQGRGGQQDLVEAYAWYVVAAKEGNKASEEALRTLTPQMTESSIAKVRLRLGRIFEEGERTPADFESAYFWYTLSALTGDPQGAVQKQKVGRLLDDRARRQVEDRAARWLKQHSPTNSQLSTATPSGR